MSSGHLDFNTAYNFSKDSKTCNGGGGGNKNTCNGKYISVLKLLLKAYDNLI